MSTTQQVVMNYPQNSISHSPISAQGQVIMPIQQQEYMRFGEISSGEKAYQINAGYYNIFVLFIILVIGIWILNIILKTVFGIDLTNTKDKRNKFIIGGIALYSAWWVMHIITSGNIGKFGKQIEKGDRTEIAGLKRVARRFSR